MVTILSCYLTIKLFYHACGKVDIMPFAVQENQIIGNFCFSEYFGLKIARHICMLGIFKDDKFVQLYYWVCGSISNVKMTTVYCMLPSLSYKLTFNPFKGFFVCH